VGFCSNGSERRAASGAESITELELGFGWFSGLDESSRTMPCQTCQASEHEHELDETTGHRGICRRHLDGAARFCCCRLSVRPARLRRLRHGSGEGITGECSAYIRTLDRESGVWTALWRVRRVRRRGVRRLSLLCLLEVGMHHQFTTTCPGEVRWPKHLPECVRVLSEAERTGHCAGVSCRAKPTRTHRSRTGLDWDSFGSREVDVDSDSDSVRLCAKNHKTPLCTTRSLTSGQRSGGAFGP
jgi:hypothetical protein